MFQVSKDGSLEIKRTKIENFDFKFIFHKVFLSIMCFYNQHFFFAFFSKNENKDKYKDIKQNKKKIILIDRRK